MERFFTLVLVFIFTFDCLNCSEASQSDCGVAGIENDILSLSVTNRRNESGEWVTSFSASKNTSDMANNLDVVLVRSSAACKGNHYLNIKGTIKDNSTKEEDRGLFFHKRCSDNAVITNNRRAMVFIRESGDASALTHRPLLDDEIFTVRLDKRKSNGALGWAIGVTTHSPDDFDIPNNMFTVKSGTWMFFTTNIYQNSTIIRKDYSSTSLHDLKIGQSIGVMKSKFGNLHFFIDGVDKGVAASKIPETVYGVFQLYTAGLQGTIIDV